MKWLTLVFAVLFLATASGPLSAQQPAGSEAALTNADVVKLITLGLGDDVAIAKLNQSPAVNFDLSPDGLAKLKSDGVSKEVMAAMLKRATPTASNAALHPALLAALDAQSLSSDVRLRSKDGETKLVGRRGEHRFIYFVFGAMNFFNYPGAASKFLTVDRRPTIIARLQDDPRDQQGGNVAFLVKLESDKKADTRALKIGQASKRVGFGAPDTDWTLPFDAEQESPGVWRIAPTADLEPGEYGLYFSRRSTLYDFAVGQ